MDTIRLNNYLRALKLSPSGCLGFEDEALGACLGLVFYQSGTHGQKLAWLIAVQNASFNSAGTTDAGPANKSFFYHRVLSRKNSAYGVAVEPRPPQDIDAIAYPWTLPEPVFRQLDAQVRRGKGLAGRPQATWSGLVKQATSIEDNDGLSTPVAVFAWSMVNKFVTKYAPKLGAMLLGPEVLAGVAAAAYGGMKFSNFAVRLSNAEAVMNFAADRTRRDYDNMASHHLMSGVH